MLLNFIACLLISLLLCIAFVIRVAMVMDNPTLLSVVIIGTTLQLLTISLLSKKFPIPHSSQIKILIETNVVFVSLLLTSIFLLLYFIFLFTFGLGTAFHPGR